MPRDKPTGRGLAFDIAKSARHKDENGYLHVERSNLTKEQVAPYYGDEIAGWQELGLSPGRVYYMYRPAKEIEKAADTFNGLPLLFEHHEISAANVPKDKVIGSLGTSAAYNAPYLTNGLIVTDAEAIAAIESGEYKELSAAYQYEADMTPGIFSGEHYDGKMANIRGNHVAIVREGRAGPDVAVADSGGKIKKKPREARSIMRLIEKLRKLMAYDAVPAIEKLEVNLAQFMKAVQVVEAQREGISPADIGIEIAPDASPEGIVELFFPEADEDTRAALADQLRALKEAPAAKEAEADEKPEEKPEEVQPEEKPEEEKAADEKDGAEIVAELIDEDTKAAMDKCGVDAESPEQAKAFAAGVKYGEELMRSQAEREKLDREHESEGMKAEIEHKIAEEVKKAEDGIKAHFKAVTKAAQDCAPIIGTLKDPLAFDSADAIYKKALDASGIVTEGVNPSAYAAMVGMLKKGMGVSAPMAQDSARDDKEIGKALSGLDRISIA